MKLNKILIILIFVTSCTRSPDSIRIFKLAHSSNYFSEEIIKGRGPVSSDYTRVFFHKNEKELGILVASGDFLKVDKIVEGNDHKYLLCLSEGKRDRPASDLLEIEIDGVNTTFRSSFDC